MAENENINNEENIEEAVQEILEEAANKAEAAEAQDTQESEASDALMEKASEYAEENKKSMSKKKKVNFVYDSIIALCIVVFCVSAFFLGRWLWQNYRTASVTDNAKDMAGLSEETVSTEGGKVIAGMEGDDGDGNFSYLDLNMAELYEKNSDVVGWIRVNGTLVDYPVVQCGNNDYYLARDFEGNITGAGCPFLDFRNDAANIAANRNFVIYGHARKDRSIFGSLDFCRQGWWQSEPGFHLIRYTSLNQKTVWRIFSAYTINVDEFYYIQTEFSGDEEFQEFADTLVNLSECDFGVPVGAGDTIMTLSTCAYNGDDRLVVHAKLVQIEDYNNETIGESVTNQQ